MKKMILLLLFFAVTGGCSKSLLDTGGPVEYSISGHVSDAATNTPLEGIEVELQIFDGFLLDIGREKVITDKSGIFHIDYHDNRDFVLYWAQLYIEPPSQADYQLGAIVNGEEHCRSHFAIDNIGNYEVHLLRYPAYRLQVSSVPAGWEAGRLEARLSTLNPNCSDTLVLESVSAYLNNADQMSELAKWRKINRSNSVFVNYTLHVDNTLCVSKQISAECAYGDQTDVHLILE